MKHAVGTNVTVVLPICMTDTTIDNTFVGKSGIVISHNDNGFTGNTADDPLHVVKFADDITESFWFEELIEDNA